MKIGIIELDIPNHYLAVNSIAKIYATQKENEVIIFTNDAISGLLSPLTSTNKKISIVTMQKKQTILAFFLQINDFHLDRVHIVSAYFNFKAYANHQFNCPVYLGIHNEYKSWFYKNLIKGFQIVLIKSHLGLNRDLIYNLRKTIWREIRSLYYRRKILHNTLIKGGKIVVYGPNIEREIVRFVHAKQVLQIPFAIYEELDKQYEFNPPSNKLVIGIPGIVDKRRDIKGLINFLADNKEYLKEEMKFKFIGKIDKSDPILPRFKSLIRQGFDIEYSTNYLSEIDFSKQIISSDILLGNIPFSNIKAKKAIETGVIYAMIRAGKPGLFPYGYFSYCELNDSILYYNNYHDLFQILIKLIHGHGILASLKQNAINNSRKFTPKNLYNVLLFS